MGQGPASITRNDFVTPYEFRSIEATDHPTARVGGVCIELIQNGQETRLGKCYQQIPLRVMPPFTFDTESAALLYYINLTAGLMDGDAHLIDILARSGTRSVVTGQSANRVHPALNSYSTQQFKVQVEDDAILVSLPAPTIPYQGSRYFQHTRIDLDKSGRLIWGDIWLPGRYDRGQLSERYQFEKIVQECEVYRERCLIYRDRFRWNGPWTPVEKQWHFGDSLSSASLIIVGPTRKLEYSSSPLCIRSVFSLQEDVTCLRWCGHPMHITSDLVQVALQVAGFWTGGDHAPPWFLESNSLSPSHWFSTHSM